MLSLLTGVSNTLLTLATLQHYVFRGARFDLARRYAYVLSSLLEASV